jgi:hypothetical protein
MSLLEFQEPQGYPASKRSEIFEQMHESTNWFSIQYDNWHLPGTDDKKEDCGKWLTKGCLNVEAHSKSEYKGKIYIKTFQKSCYRADCEICYKKWMAREANKSTRRIEKYEKLSGKNVKHIIVSVPLWLHYTPKKELAKQSYKILKEIGCIGGATVFHPFRYRKECKEWYYSPHFHVLGFGWIEKTAENYQKNGWVVKNKGTRDSTFATVYYQLSHAGIKKRHHTLVWFGDLSYSKLKMEEEPENGVCPICKGELRLVYHYGLYGYDPPPETEVELFVDPEGWHIVEYNQFGSRSSKNPRNGEFVNNGQGVGTDYEKWLYRKSSHLTDTTKTDITRTNGYSLESLETNGQASLNDSCLTNELSGGVKEE